MNCATPILLRHPHTKEPMEVPCGNCISCRVNRQSDLIFYGTREIQTQYKKGFANSMVTLTYNDLHLPLSHSGHPTLRKKDVQLFLKRLRKYISNHYKELKLPQNHKFKYMYSGEYGGQTNRPHYHIIFFGLSKTQLTHILPKVWKSGLFEFSTKKEKIVMGRPEIEVLDSGGLRYVTKYITKGYKGKAWKKTLEHLGIEPEFICRSQKIGYEWIEQHAEEIIENEGFYNKDGKRQMVPRLVRKKLGIKPDLEKIQNAILEQAKKDGLTMYEYQIRQRLLQEEILIKRERMAQHPVDDTDFQFTKKAMLDELDRIRESEKRRKARKVQFHLSRWIYVTENWDKSKGPKPVIPVEKFQKYLDTPTNIEDMIGKYMSYDILKELSTNDVNILSDAVLDGYEDPVDYRPRVNVS